MDLEHSFIIPVPPERAWEVLLDVESVAPCMPGATVESVEGDVVKGRIKVKVGPVMLTYSGSARFVERDDQQHSVTLEASGKETRGSGTAAATVRSSLRDEGGQTRVTVTTTLTVTGRPAQFGRGVLAEVGGKIIERFATNLATQLAGAGQQEATASANGAGRGTAVPGPAPAATAQRGLPIDELKLPARAYNSLRREGVLTVGNLCDCTEDQLRAIEHIGPQAIKEIRHKLADRGLSLTEAAPAETAGAASAAGPSRTRPPDRAGTAVTAGPAGPAQAVSPTPAATTTGGPGGTAAGPADTPPPPAPRAPYDEAIDLLGTAGIPVLKRTLPLAGGLLILALAVRRLRRRGRYRGA